MTWTYDGDLVADRDKLRLLIGDIDQDRPLFQDGELDYFLSNAATVLDAGADALDSAANRFARDFDFIADGTTVKKSQVSEMLAERATKLREAARRVAGGVVTVTRVDGHSDDVSALATDAVGNFFTFDVGRWDEVGKDAFGFIR